MLESLKFVQGSIAKKDFIPALKHFVIEGGLVRGYNGTLALCSPIPFNLSCKPKADPLIRAIGNCEETVAMTITPAGRLSLKSGKFKVFIDCIDGDTPHVMPEGQMVEINGAELLKAFKTVAPFIGDDASRPWSNGVLLRGQSALATNNVTIVEYWTGVHVPCDINIPRDAVKEILRINQPPVSAQMTENSITLHFPEGRWLRTQLLSTEWPDLSRVLDRPSNATAIDTRLFDGMEIIKPFEDKMGRVLFYDGGVRTHHDEAEGSSFDIDGFSHTGVYAHDMLKLLDGVATSIDWTTYPAPCMFFGDRLRGAIIGMRQ